MVNPMRKARGMTLVELLTVIAIAAILAYVAVPSFGKIIATQRIKTAASNLQVALMSARSEAVKRNTSIYLVQASSGTWTQGWAVKDGTSAGANTLASYSATSNIAITGPTQVMYQGSGRATTTPSGTTSFKFSSTSVGDVRCVNIGTSGAVSVASSGC